MRTNCRGEDWTYNSLIDADRRNLRYQVYGPLLVDLLLQPSHGEPHVAGVGLGELLAGVGDLVLEPGGEGEGPPAHLLGEPGEELATERHV